MVSNPSFQRPCRISVENFRLHINGIGKEAQCSRDCSVEEFPLARGLGALNRDDMAVKQALSMVQR